MKLGVVIPAAGGSTRYAAAGGLRSKLDEDLGGRPVLQRTIELFANLESTALIVVAAPADEYDDFIEKHGDRLGLAGVRVCRGGAEHRWQSVKNALEVIPTDCTHIAVHDAARPCTPSELIERMLAAAEKFPAVIPAVEVSDTLKRIGKAPASEATPDPVEAILGKAGKTRYFPVEATVPRERLFAVQTPQVFEAALLRRAYAQSDLSSTDDAGLVERLGEQVVIVEGDPRNIKITRPVDLEMVRKVMGVRAPEGRAVHKRF